MYQYLCTENTVKEPKIVILIRFYALTIFVLTRVKCRLNNNEQPVGEELRGCRVGEGHGEGCGEACGDCPGVERGVEIGLGEIGEAHMS